MEFQVSTRRLVLLALSIAAVSSAAHECDESALLPGSQKRLEFPRELRIDAEWVPTAAAQHPQGPLALKLGGLFAKSENVPGFWSESALAVVEPMEERVPAAVVERVLSRFGISASEREMAAMTALTGKLMYHFAEILDEEEVVLLAHLLRKEKINDLRAAEQPHITAETLASSGDGLTKVVEISDKQLIEIVPVINTPHVRELADALVESDKVMLTLLQDGDRKLYTPEMLAQAKEEWREQIRLARRELKTDVGGNIAVASTIAGHIFVIADILIRSGLDDPEFAAKMHRLPRNILDDLEEMLIPLLGVKSHTDEFIRLVDSLYFGTPYPAEPEATRVRVMENAKSLLFPFKNEISRLKGQATLEQKNRLMAVNRPWMFTARTSNPFVGATPKPAKVKTRGTARTEPLETSAAKPAANDLLDFAHFHGDSGRFRVDGAVYEFDFIRNPSAGRQKLRFTAEAQEELNALGESEARRLIGALVMGYTNRSARAASGVKHLIHEGKNGRVLYEARPGHLDLRMILTRTEAGEWLALGVVDKAHFQRSVARRF